MAFTGVTTGGYITANTTGTSDPNISTSNINAAKNVNRYWTLTNNSTVGGSYKPTFTYTAADLDAGVTASTFIAQEYTGSSWASLTTGTTTTTSTPVTSALTAFGDFAIGNAKTTTTTTVISSLNPACQGSSVTFTATVKSGATLITTGDVSFF